MSIKPLTNNSSNQPYSSTNLKDNPNDEVALQTGLVFEMNIKSKFNSEIEVNQKMWAVTLVVDNTNSYITTFHTRIVFEGIKEDIGPFFQIAHLQGPKTWRNPQEISNCWFGWSKSGKVQPGRMIPLSEKTLDISAYRSKTNTWLKSRKKVELMIQSIIKESEDKQPVPFSFFGKNSMLTKEMEFFTTDHPELLKMQEESPAHFVDLCQLHDNQHRAINSLYMHYTSCWNNRYHNNPLEFSSLDFSSLFSSKWGLNDVHFICHQVDSDINSYPSLSLIPMRRFFMSQTYDWMCNKIRLVAGRLPVGECFLPDIGSVILSTALVPLDIASHFIDKSREDKELLQIRDYKVELLLIHMYVKKITKIANSCFTWAKEKLELIDVEMPECGLDKFISVSTLYANQLISPSDKSEELDEFHSHLQ